MTNVWIKIMHSIHSDKPSLMMMSGPHDFVERNSTVASFMSDLPESVFNIDSIAEAISDGILSITIICRIDQVFLGLLQVVECLLADALYILGCRFNGFSSGRNAFLKLHEAMLDQRSATRT
jgi:hypothetical protein